YVSVSLWQLSRCLRCVRGTSGRRAHDIQPAGSLMALVGSPPAGVTNCHRATEARRNSHRATEAQREIARGTETKWISESPWLCGNWLCVSVAPWRLALRLRGSVAVLSVFPWLTRDEHRHQEHLCVSVSLWLLL